MRSQASKAIVSASVAGIAVAWLLLGAACAPERRVFDADDSGAARVSVDAPSADAESASGNGGETANDAGGSAGASPIVDAAEVPPLDSAADSPPEAPPLSHPPYDWVGILGTGQSLAVGGGPAINMTKTQPFKNLKLVDNGPDPKYPIEPSLPSAGSAKWATTPLLEPIRVRGPGTGPGYSDGQYPNDIEGETPHSGMANTLSALWMARGLGDYVTAHGEFGWSGRCLASIDKAGGMRAYPASLNEARVWKTLAAQAQKTFGYAAIILTHGECDATNQGYGAGVYQLWKDYDADLKAITGQVEDVVMLASQQSSSPAGATSSAVQVWQAGVAHPRQIICTGPKYPYQYLPDNLHLPAPGYERLGQKYAEVFDLVVNQKAAWQPVQPEKLTRSGATITIDFHVPQPPLVWDAHVSPPHQQVNTEWAAGKGFEVTNAAGARLKIASVVIDGARVLVTLSQDPGAGKVTVAYAVTADGGAQGGLRGQLRDSDEFVGWDAETLDVQVTQGSPVVKSVSPGALIHRTGWDIVTGPGVPTDTIVQRHDSDDQLTLSTPWPAASGAVKLSFHHDERNFCVHFSSTEP